MFYADESDTGARAERRAPVEDPRHPDPVFGAPDPMSVSAALDDETRSIDHSWIGLSSDIDPTEEPARESALEPDTETAVPPRKASASGGAPPTTVHDRDAELERQHDASNYARVLALAREAIGASYRERAAAAGRSVERLAAEVTERALQDRDVAARRCAADFDDGDSNLSEAVPTQRSDLERRASPQPPADATPPRTPTLPDTPARPARGVDSTRGDTDSVQVRYTGVSRRVYRVPGCEREPAGCPEDACAIQVLRHFVANAPKTLG